MPEHPIPEDTSTYEELARVVKPGQKWGAVIGGIFVDGVGPPEVPTKEQLSAPQAGRRAAARAKGREEFPAPGPVRRPLHRRFGYDVVDGAYVPRTDEQEIIAKIQQLRNGGSSPRAWAAVADQLNAEGIPPPSGAGWYAMTCRRIAQREDQPPQPPATA
ncbi:MAG: hypothetical protein WKF94_18955 [Solirubrobacteraceae bacterium]